ncbi:hypothetical protein ACFX13_017829 [Malus domestica]|uniref:protein ALP1-like n=1 Tax=Malus sylvestris TaxID=3752 RepID=UPI0010AA5620|nr:protein ALP1-like [Malus domestica]XP_050125203.1 protein ALP1-like [Malus sylvestris]
MAAGGGGGKGAAKSTTKGKDRNKKQNQTHNNNNNKPLNQHHLVSLVTAATSLAHSFLSQNDLLLLPAQTLTLESLLSSASTSLSTLLCFPNPPPPTPLRPPPTPLECWFSRFLSATAAGGDFDSHWSQTFRMSEHSFSVLLSLLSPFLKSTVPSIPPNFVLAAAIYRLAHGASYKAVGRRFGLDSVEACRAFYAVCKAVNDQLGNLFEFRSDISRVSAAFRWISLPNCCGVLGFSRFGVGGEVLGANGSLLVQAVVDSEGRFLDVSAGWPSTMKPESIFRQSKLYLGVEESRDLLNGPAFELGNGNSIPQYILGDSCFPLLPWLLTPYVRSDEADSFSSMEKAFNSVHTRAMGLVGTAFGRVRSRWQLLARQWKEECVEFLPFVVVTGCLLHNFLIKCSEPMPDDNVKGLKEEELPVFDGQVNESGERMRDVLAMHLSRVSLRR